VTINQTYIAGVRYGGGHCCRCPFLGLQQQMVINDTAELADTEVGLTSLKGELATLAIGTDEVRCASKRHPTILL
jgi:hypothetical protein